VFPMVPPGATIAEALELPRSQIAGSKS